MKSKAKRPVSRKSNASKRTKSDKPKPLDEETSALVLAEYLTVGEVSASEIDAIMSVPHVLSNREIALTFRMSEVLETPDAFEMAPRFRSVFATIRAGLAQVQEIEANVAPDRELAAAGAGLGYLHKHDRRAYQAVLRVLEQLVANAQQESRAA